MKTKTIEITPLHLAIGAAALYFFTRKPSSSSPSAEETAANEAASARRVLPDTAAAQGSNYAVPRPQTSRQLPDTYEASSSNAQAATVNTAWDASDDTVADANALYNQIMQQGMNGFGFFGADPAPAQLDPRREQWLALSQEVQEAQAEIDAAWASYSSSIMNRLCSASGMCPAYQSVADLVTSSDALASALIALSQELQGDPDSKYDDGSRKDTVYQQLGAKYVGSAQTIVQTIGDDNATSAIKDFIVRFPQSIRTVLAWTAQTAANTAGQLGLGLAGTLAIVAGGVALAGWLLKKGGVSVNTKYVKAG